MGGPFAVRLLFEWGGGCLWGDGDTTREAFGVGPIETRLPLTPATLERLAQLSAWHDGALNRDYPPDPSPWSPGERDRFERAATEVLSDIRSELGGAFTVVYDPL